MSQQAPTAPLPTAQQSAPKRPRLSLQTKPSPAPTTLGKSGIAPKVDVDPTSATAFNTLSNAYAAAIESSSPKVSTPQTSLDPKSAVRKSGLRLVTNASSHQTPVFPSQHTQTPGAFNFNYPDSPGAVFSATSPSAPLPELWNNTPAYTFTPPQSANPTDETTVNPFSFTKGLNNAALPSSPRTPRRRATTGAQNLSAPYTHPRTLRSILRNSPLPPRSSLNPMSPTRSSLRLAERASKKLCFNNPLTQTITTERYIKSHIDLLTEDASPYSATDSSEADAGESLDLTMAYTGDETRDGGQTPGPFEEARRRMAGLEAESGSEIREKRRSKRKEKKRRWVWTIGTNEEVESEEQTPISTPKDEPPEVRIHEPDTLLQHQPEAMDTGSPVPRAQENLEQAPSAAFEVRSEAAVQLSTIIRFNERPKLLIPRAKDNLSCDVEMAERPSTSHSF
jgi:hypothetical protein